MFARIFGLIFAASCLAAVFYPLISRIVATFESVSVVMAGLGQ